MSTRFADELKYRLEPLRTDDLDSYIDGLAEMFAMSELLAREGDGYVFGENELTPPTAANIQGAEPWWFYFTYPARGANSLDPSVMYGPHVSIKATSAVTDGDNIGTAYANAPVEPGATYRWQGVVRGIPGENVIVTANLYELVNAGGAASSNAENVTVGTGWTPFEVEFTVPADRHFAYLYVLGAAVTGREQWIAKPELVRRNEVTDAAAWQRLTDIDAVVSESALLWLAQLAGVRVPVGLQLESMRDYVQLAEAQRRGTIAYMVEIAQRHLTGDKTVFTIERVTNAYRLRFVTRLDETDDPDAVEAALRAVKPAGIVLEYEAVGGITSTPSTWAGVDGALTWDDTTDEVP